MTCTYVCMYEYSFRHGSSREGHEVSNITLNPNQSLNATANQLGITERFLLAADVTGDLDYWVLDGYPASLGFPIMHRVHAIYTAWSAIIAIT